MTNWTEDQRKAIDKEKTNILVSAGAGSGKTAVLSERVLRKASTGTNIDRILILTFTNAAALEMMVRIREKLVENNLDEQVKLIDKAYITTFDAYSLSIVNKYHDILGLGKNIRIIDANVIKILKNRYIDKIFEKYYENKDPQFSRLIKDFCLKEDKTLKDWILRINEKLDLKYDRDKYLNDYIEKHYSEEYIQSTKDDYMAIIKDYMDRIREDLTFIDTKYTDILDPLLNSETFIDIKDELSKIEKLPNLARGSSDLEKSSKGDISDILKKLRELTFIDLEDNVNLYKDTKDYAEIIIKIIKELDEKIKEYKFKNNTFEFIDIAKLAINLVENNNDIREEITNSFDEIMIDEYQDTSDLQELFISLISKNNTYMVGDIKQSIYRFRNANPDIFKEKYLKYEKEDNGIKIDLNENFRSRGEVLADINKIFNKVMDLPYGGAEYEKSHQMNFGNKSYIEEGATTQKYDLEIYNYDYKKTDYSNYKSAEIEAFIIANDIKKKIESKYQVFDKKNKVLHDITYKDFVILVDKSNNFQLYKKIFEYLQIPLCIYRDVNIGESIEVYIIRNILRLINCVKNSDLSDEFKYSYVSIARSYLFRYSDDDIFDIVTNDKYKETSIYKIVEELSKKVDNLDLKNLMIRIVDKFNFDEKIITATDVEIKTSILEYFINLCEDLSSMDYDIEMFTDYLNEIIDKELKIEIPVSIGNEDSVRIMTIHKSKGLEYPVCYYTLLDGEFTMKELNNKILFDDKYGIVTPSYINGYSDTYMKTLVKKKWISEEISEKIRLLYVGLTRCMEKMIVVANLNLDNNDKIDQEKYRHLKDILNSVSKELEDYIVTVNLDDMNISGDYRKKSLKVLEKNTDKKLIVNEYKSNSSIIEKEHFSKTIHKLLTEKEISNMRFGTKIHEVFELTDFKNPNYDVLESNEKEYVKKFLELDILKNIKNANILKEYEFYLDDDSHGFIDLMLEYNDHIDIIDYKLSNIDDPNYLKQLTGYSEYIKNRTNKSVNIYLYSILNNNLKKL